MKKIFLLLICIFSFVLLASNSFAATEVQKQAAIEAGLKWLAQNQYADGHWYYDWSYGDVAATGAALVAFLEKGYKEGEDVIIDGTNYGDVIGKGLSYIFANATTYPISNQTWGNPDTDGNGVGVKFVPWGDNGRDTYVTGLALPAVALTGTPGKLVTNGPLTGWTYLQVVQNTLDYFAYGQNDTGYGEGGWRYYANSGDADNSTAQWPVLASLFTSLMGVTPPAFVESELDKWILHIQRVDGGSDYDGSWGYSNVSRTGALLLEMSYSKWYNEPAANSNPFGSNQNAFNAAVNYVNSQWQTSAWGTWEGNFGHPYAMWAVYKGLETTIGRNSTAITNLRPAAPIDPGDTWTWWEDYCDYIVNAQNPDGSWGGYAYWYGGLSNAWYISILQASVVPTHPLTIPEAANRGLINMYCYPWDADQKQYIPISGDPADDSSNIPLTPWTGFYVSVNENLDLLIPKDVVAKSAVAPSPITASTEMDPLKWYLFTVPVVPGNGDIFANFGDNFNGNYEQTWRVSKWIYDVPGYVRYNGPGTIPDLLPGRGFWAYHTNAETAVVDLEGLPVDPTGEYYELKLPAMQNGPGFHMTGNPFLYNIFWKDCRIRVPMTDALPMGKIANGKIEAWQLGLSIVSNDGKSLDTYNRAGVSMTGGMSASVLNAIDFLPPGEYIRLTLKDPNNSENGPLAYDYRNAGMNEYKWLVELTTNYSYINTRLSITDIANVPDGYSLTLKDMGTGELFALDSDKTFPVTLSSFATRTFLLTASVAEKTTGVEESKPLSFGIKGVSPNPFNPATTITYGLEQAGNVVVKIYTVNGQLVDTLVNGHMSPGTHTVTWNASGHSSGVYVAVIKANSKNDSRKITLMK